MACCAIWSLALYLISCEAQRCVGGPVVWGVVYSTHSAEKHTQLQQEGTGFGGQTGLFPKELPKDLSHLPLELMQHLWLIPVHWPKIMAYSSGSCINPGLKHILPSAFIRSSTLVMKRHTTKGSSFLRNNKRNPSFYCAFPLIAWSFSFAFLKSLASLQNKRTHHSY